MSVVVSFEKSAKNKPLDYSLQVFPGGIPGFAVRYAAGEQIHGEGEAALYSYRIISGVARTVRVLTDGRRQVEGFHFAGDIFSMELGGHYKESAEAVSETEIFVMKRSLIDALIERDPAVARELLIWANRSLARARDQMLLLGRKTALEKVASFLLQLESSGASKGAVALPMCRSDIADYLGLTVETVSRAFAELERTEAIELSTSRSIKVHCRDRLSVLACQT